MTMSKTRRLNNALRKSKKKENRLSQFDEANPGGMLKYDDKDVQAVITGKMVERIKMQYELMKAHTMAMYNIAEIEEFGKFICDKEYEKNMTDDTLIMAAREGRYNSITNKPKWYGIDMPYRLVLHELDILNAKMFDVMVKRNSWVEALKSVGFGEDHIRNVMHGKFIKEHEELKRLEDEHTKAALKEDTD